MVNIGSTSGGRYMWIPTCIQAAYTAHKRFIGDYGCRGYNSYIKDTRHQVYI